MSHGETVLGELGLYQPAGGAGLNLRHPIDRIDPLDAIHSGHVHRNDRPLLIWQAAQRLRDVRPPAVRHENDTSVHRCANDRGDLFLISWIHDVVRHSREPRRSDRIDLGDSVAVSVPQANGVVSDDLVGRESVPDFIEERVCRARLGNGRERKAPCVGLERKVDSHHLAKPWKQIRETLAAQSRITIARHGYRAGLIDREGRVLESP